MLSHVLHAVSRIADDAAVIGNLEGKLCAERKSGGKHHQNRVVAARLNLSLAQILVLEVHERRAILSFDSSDRQVPRKLERNHALPATLRFQMQRRRAV